MNVSLPLLVLSQEQLISTGVLDFERALAEVERGLGWHTTQKSISDKLVLELDPLQEWKFNSLASVDGDYCANKWLGSHLDNKKRGFPRTMATITLNDKSTGTPLCMMDGTLISAIRTGCYAGLGLKYLGKPQNTVGIIGSGVMARAALMAMAQLPEQIEEVQVYSKTPDNARRYAAQMQEKTGLQVTPTSNVREMVRRSDITVSAITKNDELLVLRDDVKPGSTHIHIGGWDDEEAYIVDCAKNGKIVCDDWELIKKRNAHPLAFAYTRGVVLDREVYGNMGELILGRKPGREGNENIYFDTVGIPEMDLVLAISAYERAREQGIGSEVQLWTQPHWILGGRE